MTTLIEDFTRAQSDYTRARLRTAARPAWRRRRSLRRRPALRLHRPALRQA